MCLISVPNLKEIDERKGGSKLLFLNQCKEEEKCEENQAIFRNIYIYIYIQSHLNFDHESVT